MAQLIVYLAFQGKGNEAFEFYQSVFGGKLDLMKMSQSPMAAQIPENEQNNIMHGALESEKITIYGSDMSGPTGITPGTNVSLCLVCESKEEIESLFTKISEGGNVTQPLHEEFFGTYGDLTDKFGFRWMFQYSDTPTQ